MTVLALLPTATENILEALPVESITRELQEKKAERLARSSGVTPSNERLSNTEFSSGAPSISAATDDDGRSLRSDSGFVHASQNLLETTSGLSKKTKAQLWEELKIQSITRTFTLIYTLSLLTLLTRIQLNLLGRRNYLSSVVTLASHSLSTQQAASQARPGSNNSDQDGGISLENRDEDASTYLSRASYGNDFETNRQYLTFSWYLLHRGFHALSILIRSAVTDTFGPINPREDISLSKLSELTLAIRRRIEGATPTERLDPHRWLPFLLPPPEEEIFVLSQSGGSPEVAQLPPSPALRRLLNETNDLLTSPHAGHVLTLMLDAAFTFLIDSQLATQSFPTPPSLNVEDSNTLQSDELQDTSQITTKLASVLAGMTRAAHIIGGTGLATSGTSRDDETAMKNTYLEKIEEVGELAGLSAVVFSANWNSEDIDDEPELPSTMQPIIPHPLEGGLEEVAQPDVSETAVASSLGFESAWGKAISGDGSQAASSTSREG